MSVVTDAPDTPAAARTDGRLRPHADDPARQVADLPAPCVQAHAANVMSLGDGALGCVWFGGSMEGRADISVFFSRLEPGASAWSAPEQLSHDPDRSEQNPVLFPAPDGTLWLLHTAQTSGHQNTAFVRRRVSRDHGRSWGPVETLVDTPGTFVRQPPHIAADGSLLLPVFTCRSATGQTWDGSLDDSAVLRSTDLGATWQRIAVPHSLGCVHMNLVPSAEGRGLLAFFRSRWADRVHATRSDDGGLSWAAPWPTVLPNNNSSIQAIRLADGRRAMVFNASSAADAAERRESLYDELGDELAASARSGDARAETQATAVRRAFWGAPRAPLTLALSADDGATWPWQRHLETGDGYCLSNNSAEHRNREVSYPSIHQTADGALHLAYTVFRQHIRHVRVMPDWVTAGDVAADTSTTAP
jgi:predicted neuraminidase